MCIDLETNMDENSLSRIQPLLTICRYFGITYFTHKNTITTIFSFILNVVIKLTVVVIYIIRAYCYIPNLKLDTTSPVLTFNNAAQLILGLIYVILKWILYFAKRKKMEDIISKVTQQTGACHLTLFLTFRWLHWIKTN